MQGVMVLRKPKQGMAGVAGEEFRDDAKAVEVWRQAGADDGGLFAPAERGGTGDKPAGEEMGDGAHARRTALR